MVAHYQNLIGAMLMKIAILFREKFSHITKIYVAISFMVRYLFINRNHFIKEKFYRPLYLLGTKD